MGHEIERKFLVHGSAWKNGVRGTRISQGYLSLDKQRTVRVRAADDQAWLTVKGLTTSVTRVEYEYEIPAADARYMLEHLCLQPIIDKTRYAVDYAGHRWEIDEFHGANEGLRVAEIELRSEDENFERPPWLATEVSGEARYYNARLVEQPYKDW